MNLHDALLNRDASFDHKVITKKVLSDKALQQELMGYVFSASPTLSSRASWIMSHCAEKEPGMLKAYDNKLIRHLARKDLHQGVIRNILRVYQDRDVPAKSSTFLLDACYAYLTNAAQPIAIRAFSISVLFNISKGYPELLQELDVVLSGLPLSEEGPAVKTRARHVLALIKKLKTT